MSSVLPLSATRTFTRSDLTARAQRATPIIQVRHASRQKNATLGGSRAHQHPPRNLLILFLPGDPADRNLNYIVYWDLQVTRSWRGPASQSSEISTSREENGLAAPIPGVSEPCQKQENQCIHMHVKLCVYIHTPRCAYIFSFRTLNDNIFLIRHTILGRGSPHE